MRSKLCMHFPSHSREVHQGDTSLDPNKTKVWNELVEFFVDQFIFNTMIDVNLRDLKTTKQGVRETFSEYMTRWKTKAS